MNCFAAKGFYLVLHQSWIALVALSEFFKSALFRINNLQVLLFLPLSEYL
jgi:hypothetical protein